MKILLVKFEYLYIQYAWISIMKKQNSNQNGKVEKTVVLVKTFDHYHHKFQLLQLSCKIAKECELKFSSKLNHGYLDSAVWKALYNFKIKRALEVRHNQFFFQNIQNNEIFEIFKMFKNHDWINFYHKKSVVLGLLVLFSTGNTFFGQIWSKNSNYQFKLKFCT